jgi:hypothetical protein
VRVLTDGLGRCRTVGNGVGLHVSSGMEGINNMEVIRTAVIAEQVSKDAKGDLEYLSAEWGISRRDALERVLKEAADKVENEAVGMTQRGEDDT